MSELEPYEALAALAERELVLVRGEQLPTLEELDALLRERDALVEALPAEPPAGARPALARAMALQEQTTAELGRRAAEVRRSIGDVELGRRVARGYGTTGVASGGLDWAG
ncbi:hypothetical protein [Conexibacter arvalis]|uniref:Flagellar protein FliT n=1 Tax=Conexibacter arvalis TaxID=912552 RepID=A0A840IA68_9ACTN|nr:hypothetical protein [Conexibacter arvalis]MBB4661014.1 hypothetical protein [Conexibacter arvalis]